MFIKNHLYTSVFVFSIIPALFAQESQQQPQRESTQAKLRMIDGLIDFEIRLSTTGTNEESINFEEFKKATVKNFKNKFDADAPTAMAEYPFLQGPVKIEEAVSIYLDSLYRLRPFQVSSKEQLSLWFATKSGVYRADFDGVEDDLAETEGTIQLVVKDVPDVAFPGSKLRVTASFQASGNNLTIENYALDPFFKMDVSDSPTERISGVSRTANSVKRVDEKSESKALDIVIGSLVNTLVEKIDTHSEKIKADPRLAVSIQFLAMSGKSLQEEASVEAANKLLKALHNVDPALSGHGGAIIKGF